MFGVTGPTPAPSKCHMEHLTPQNLSTDSLPLAGSLTDGKRKFNMCFVRDTFHKLYSSHQVSRRKERGCENSRRGGGAPHGVDSASTNEDTGQLGRLPPGPFPASWPKPAPKTTPPPADGKMAGPPAKPSPAPQKPAPLVSPQTVPLMVTSLSPPVSEASSGVGKSPPYDRGWQSGPHRGGRESRRPPSRPARPVGTRRDPLHLRGAVSHGWGHPGGHGHVQGRRRPGAVVTAVPAGLQLRTGCGSGHGTSCPTGSQTPQPPCQAKPPPTSPLLHCPTAAPCPSQSP